MKRPSFQFYPADWRANANLRRCSDAARGAWMDILCILHDSDTYGIVRWPLAELARAAGVPIKLARELVAKQVLKGSDTAVEAYTFAPRHAGQAGSQVTLVPAGPGPVWFCSRFIRDEWIRLRRGQATRFDNSFPASPSPMRETSAPLTTPAKGDDLGKPPVSTSDEAADALPVGPRPAVQVLLRLNELTGRKYEPIKSNLTPIEKRLGEIGQSGLPEVFKMLERQVHQWKNDPKMGEYLRISTLFNPTKFHEYYSARDLANKPPSDRIERLKELERATRELQTLGKLTDYSEGSTAWKRIKELKPNIEGLRKQLGVVA